jgi:uncharacterized protein YciI
MIKKVLFVVLLGNLLFLTNLSQAETNNQHDKKRPEIYYIIHSKLLGDMKVLKKTLPAHLEHLNKLQNRGKLFAAGPTLVPADTVDKFEVLENNQAIGGDGIIILRVDTRAEAEEIAQSDPFHQAGIRRYEILPWIISKGSVTLQ